MEDDAALLYTCTASYSRPGKISSSYDSHDACVDIELPHSPCGGNQDHVPQYLVGHLTKRCSMDSPKRSSLG